ncbi:hypothetical protein SAMN05216202_0700 [Pseudomonas mucidolens]|uniref:Uncharacterized protein n=1 Tax=Pseudomonas mucidolens TaxID=46679 RepID=A0A1H2LY82_9PSED|nr:hypothetical protein SAMN05216202_0700 [Pseudomonas mucidolens]SQH34993.1 Uncharacterised protein [Pseudomonas mucidolens]
MPIWVSMNPSYKVNDKPGSSPGLLSVRVGELAVASNKPQKIQRVNANL